MSRCFILGAGFSKSCGLPLASELTQQVFERAFPTDGYFRPDIREHWLGYLRHLYPQMDLASNWPDFEDLITVVDEWGLVQSEYEQRDLEGEPKSPPHFKRTLLRHLALLLCEKASEATPSALNSVQTFVESLDLNADSVISFNWDALIEIVCYKMKIEVGYGSRPDAGLWMAKPHGSVTLAELPRHEFGKMQKMINVRNVHVDWEYSDVVVVRADDPSDAANRILGPNDPARIAMVEPTARKVYRSPWIKMQWRNAYDMLRRADEINIIGFSMPNTDYRPRVVLQAAMFGRSTMPVVQLVDPSAANLAVRYGEVLTTPVSLIESDWEDWIEATKSER